MLTISTILLKICSRKLLYDLCLVNKAFHAEFSPFLYKEIQIRSLSCFAQTQAAAVLTNDYTHYTIALAVRGCNDRAQWASGGEYEGDEPEPEDNLEDEVRSLLLKLTKLQSFTWTTALSQARLDAAQQSFKNLKHLYIDYPFEEFGDFEIGFQGMDETDSLEQEQFEYNRRMYRYQDVSRFAALTSLTITNIYTELKSWTKQLAQVLLQSPGLVNLSLGLSLYAVASYEPEFFNFFESLCDKYSRIGGLPLKLRTMKFGRAIFPNDIHTVETIMDLSHLQEVHLENEDIESEFCVHYYIGDVPYDIFLSSSRCPHLRRFSATKFQTDILEVLCSQEAAGIVSQLGISFEDLDEDEGGSQLLRANPQYPNLPLKLRMMDLDLGRRSYDGQSVAMILTDLVSSGADSLEGVAIHLLSDDTGLRHVDLLKHALSQCLRLTQLLVLSKQVRMPQAETDVAELLSVGIPHLKYIGIQDRFWYIRRPRDSSVELESLDDPKEREHVEIFVHTILDPRYLT